MEKSLMYIKWSLYLYASFFLIWNASMLIFLQELDSDIVRGLLRGFFVAVLVYYMFKDKKKLTYWVLYIWSMFYSVIGLTTLPFLIKYLPSMEAGSDQYYDASVMIILIPLLSLLLLIAVWHMSKKEVRKYLISESLDIK